MFCFLKCCVLLNGVVFFTIRATVLTSIILTLDTIDPLIHPNHLDCSFPLREFMLQIFRFNGHSVFSY